MAAILKYLLIFFGAACVVQGNQKADEVLQRIRRQTSSGCNLADIIFVLDSSGSIGLENWRRVLAFVRSVVNNLDIGPYATHVGLVNYGNRATKIFDLNTHKTKASMLAAININAVPWKDQKTNTSGGIWMMREMFKRPLGDRRQAPNVGIVITDGESNSDNDKTIPYAGDAKRDGIVMFAIGIGNQTKKEELEGIAKNRSFVFSAADFRTLSKIQAQVVSAACDIPVDCTANRDLVFVLDSSGSVGRENFDKMKTFVQTMIDNINVDVDTNSHVGLMTYDSRARAQFYLNQYFTRDELKKAVAGVRYTFGTTNTAAALKLLREEMFTSAKGSRSKYPNMAVVFTDGGSDKFPDTVNEARLAKLAGIQIIVVAVGNWVNKVEINEIATDPDRANVYSVANFNDITKITSSLKTTLCDQTNECDSNPCRNGGTCETSLNSYICKCPSSFAGINCEKSCPSKADLVIALDSSGSYGVENYYKALAFTKDLVRALNIDGGQKTRIGLETFATSTDIKFNLNTYTNKRTILNALTFPYSRGRTNTAAALKVMKDSMFTDQNGNRRDVPNIGLVITDGKSNNRPLTFTRAIEARKAGINLMAVAINVMDIYGQRELRGIASDPDEQNLINVPGFAAFGNVRDKLVDAICYNQNRCGKNPCQGGGVCINELSGYTCKCPSGRTGINCERGCDGQADVVFVIDASGSIRESRFRMVLDYVKSTIKQLEIGENKARVGVVTYGDRASVNLHLNGLYDKGDILQTVENLRWIRGRTHTADALKLMRESMFVSQRGDRDNVPNYAIIVTDGESNVNKDKTLTEAAETRIAGAHMIVVAVGDKKNSLEIKGLASDPDAKNILSVDKFDQLPTIRTGLVNAMCDSVNECSSNPCKNGAQCVNGLGQFVCRCTDRYTGTRCDRQCTRRRDVVFILDASGSVEDVFDLAQRLTKRIVQGLNFAGGRTRVGVLTYSDSARVRFHLNKYSTRQSVLNSIAFIQARGKTNTAAGIDEARRNMFISSAGDRSGDPNYAIVITDGQSNINQDRTIPAANDARKAGITLMAIGIGENGKVDRAEINGIASDSQHSFILQNESQFDSIANQVLDRLCQ